MEGGKMLKNYREIEFRYSLCFRCQLFSIASWVASLILLTKDSSQFTDMQMIAILLSSIIPFYLIHAIQDALMRIRIKQKEWFTSLGPIKAPFNVKLSYFFHSLSKTVTICGFYTLMAVNSVFIVLLKIPHA